MDHHELLYYLLEFVLFRDEFLTFNRTAFYHSNKDTVKKIRTGKINLDR